MSFVNTFYHRIQFWVSYIRECRPYQDIHHQTNIINYLSAPALSDTWSDIAFCYFYSDIFQCFSSYVLFDI